MLQKSKNKMRIMKASTTHTCILLLCIARVHCSCDFGGSKKHSLTGDMVEDTPTEGVWDLVEPTTPPAANVEDVPARTTTAIMIQEKRGLVDAAIQTEMQMGELTPPEAPKEVGLRETTLIRAQILPKD